MRIMLQLLQVDQEPGKTTIIKSIIEIYQKKKNKIMLAAPTRTCCKKNDGNDWI